MVISDAPNRLSDARFCYAIMRKIPYINCVVRLSWYVVPVKSADVSVLIQVKTFSGQF